MGLGIPFLCNDPVKRRAMRCFLSKNFKQLLTILSLDLNRVLLRLGHVN